MGLVVHKYAANHLVLIGCVLSCIAPLLMAFAEVHTSFWKSGEFVVHAHPPCMLTKLGFLANVFNAVGADALFTVSNLLITSVFPAKTQALAGGVFNTVSQIGKTVGLALVAVIASSVTAKSKHGDKTSPEALLEGYRATFWFCFAATVATVIICLWDLRSIGRVGHKHD